MPIYSLKKNFAAQLPLKKDGFGDEFSLRDSFASNLEQLFGIRFLAKEYPTTDGRIDTLGLDENNAPVIIEYKWKESEEVLSQGLFYLDWLLKNKRHFELLVDKILGQKTKVRWEHPRVILVAQGFSRYVKAAAQRVDNVELMTYSLYEGDILHIETEYSPTPQRTSATRRAAPQETGTSYTLEYHLNMTSPEMRSRVSELRERLLQLPGVEEKLGQKTGITYRTTKSFVRLEFRRTWIQLLLRSRAYPEDTKKFVNE